MKKIITTGILTLCFAATLALAAGQGFAAEPQTTCPVMGNPVNKELYVDYKGKRVYFCCPPCVQKFKQHPEAYLKKLKQQGQEPIDIPAE